jgi:hypothetical protein
MASIPRHIPTREEVLVATRKSQEAMIAAVRTWSETARTAAPKLMSVYAPLTDALPKIQSVYAPLADKLLKLTSEHMSVADRLPTPEEAVASAYNVAERMLASQRKFAEDMLKATAPLRAGRRTAWQEAATVKEPEAVAEGSAAESTAPGSAAAEGSTAESTAAPQNADAS